MRRKRNAPLVRTAEDIKREFERQCRIAALKEAAKVVVVAMVATAITYAIVGAAIGQITIW